METNRKKEAFDQFCRGKSFSLIGLGVSHAPLVGYLYAHGAEKVIVRDLKKEESDPAVKKAVLDGAEVRLGKNYLEDLTQDVILRSPGIRPDLPEFLTAVERGSLLTGESELFMRYCPCRRIAVTGSDGKTTTTTLISEILKTAGYRVFLGGNIGKALLCQLDEIEENDFAVMELSSFQLIDFHFSPEIAVVTNLEENHLDWHKGMQEYLDSKMNLLSHQSREDTAILGFDNAITKSLPVCGKKLYFSLQGDSFDEDGVFYDHGSIFRKKNGKRELILKASDIVIPGRHNILNYMAAAAATLPFVSPETIQTVAKTFPGVEHRIELVREVGQVKYYNSSIDSSPSRSTACLNSFSEPVILIAGGYDKHLDYAAFGSVVCRKAKSVYLIGQTAQKIQDAVCASELYRENSPKITRCADLKEALILASKEAKPGDKVLLSPASASFDQFKNFEERGNLFKKLVKEL